MSFSRGRFWRQTRTLLRQTFAAAIPELWHYREWDTTLVNTPHVLSVDYVPSCDAADAWLLIGGLKACQSWTTNCNLIYSPQNKNSLLMQLTNIFVFLKLRGNRAAKRVPLYFIFFSFFFKILSFFFLFLSPHFFFFFFFFLSIRSSFQNTHLK